MAVAEQAGLAREREPRGWERTEVVLGAWWLIGAGTPAWLLHRGARLADDLSFHPRFEARPRLTHRVVASPARLFPLR